MIILRQQRIFLLLRALWVIWLLMSERFDHVQVHADFEFFQAKLPVQFVFPARRPRCQHLRILVAAPMLA